MKTLTPRVMHVLRNPAAFALQTLRAFRANHGLLLAGAVAYYALLSIVPLLILSVIALSHIVDQAELLRTLARYLEWLVPSQSRAVIGELSGFLDNRGVIGGVLLVTMLFFSSLGFAVIEQAMAAIFSHRAASAQRHFLVSALLPYCCVLVLGLALLLVTVAATGVQAIGRESVEFFGRVWPLVGVSGALLYLLGLGSEILLLTTVYLIIPIGRTSPKHALMGGVTATLLWEIVRHALVWYFANLSQASVVYGSLATAIVVLLTLEIAATLLLFGAQVIAEYERVV